MDDDDLSYLQADFDPASLTVALIRGLLVKHDVSYPSGAKKAELVEIFNNQLKPQGRKLLSAQRRVHRTSRGIEDAASSTATTQEGYDDDDDNLLLPSSPVKKGRGRPKKITKSTEDETDSTLAPATTTKSKTRTDAKSRERKKSISRTPAPQIKNEEDTPGNWRKFDDDSPFSAENPFQSGSSPPHPPTTVSKRRRTDGPVAEKRTSTGRRKTDNARILRQTSSHFQIPVSDHHLEDAEEIEAGEEFEESEQIELEHERRKRNEAVVPVRRSHKSKSSGTITSVLKFGLGAAAVALTGLWRQEKVQVGYCGVGEASEFISNLELPDWVQANILPACEPCPPHATCYSHLRTECEKGYVLSRNLASLGGVIPIVPSCRPDGELQKRQASVTNRLVSTLHTQNARVACSLPDERGHAVTSAEISEDSLKEALASKKHRSMSDEDFNALFDSSISNVGQHEHIEVSERDGQRFYRSHSQVRFPVSCILRQSILRSIGRYSRLLIGSLMVITSFYATGKYLQNRLRLRSEAQLYATRVFTRLSNHANESDEEYVSINRMRDDVLRDEFSSARRKRVWGAVEKLVEQNANVRTKVGPTESGDIGKGWRWIGRGGQNVSRSVSVVNTPLEGRSHSELEQVDRPSMSELRRWKVEDEPKF